MGALTERLMRLLRLLPAGPPVPFASAADRERELADVERRVDLVARARLEREARIEELRRRSRMA